MASTEHSIQGRKKGPVRILLAAAGFLSVGLAFIGVFVPGLPTTPFLLLAGFCLGRSFPAAAHRVLSAPIFKPYRPYLDGRKPIPKRAKWAATFAMWGMIFLSLYILHHSDSLHPLLAALILIGGVIGTWMLWSFLDRRRLAALNRESAARNACEQR